MPQVVKRVPHCELFDDGVIQLSGVRVSYPNVLVPYEGKNDDGKPTKNFGVIGILPKTPEWEPARQLIMGEIDKVLAAHPEKGQPLRIPADNKFLRDGDRTVKTEYENAWQVHTGNGDKPPIALHRLRDPKTGKPRKLTLADDKDLIYGGCYCNIILKPWFQNNVKGGKRVNANFVAIMYVKEGKPFGEGRISEDDAAERMNSYAEDDTGGGYGDTEAGEEYVDPNAI